MRISDVSRSSTIFTPSHRAALRDVNRWSFVMGWTLLLSTVGSVSRLPHVCVIRAALVGKWLDDQIPLRSADVTAGLDLPDVRLRDFP